MQGPGAMPFVVADKGEWAGLEQSGWEKNVERRI